MANIISIMLGLVALIFALPAMLPLLGWMNWGILLVAGIGVAFGFVSQSNSGRNFCLVVMAICALRLWLGGGLL